MRHAHRYALICTVLLGHSLVSGSCTCSKSAKKPSEDRPISASTSQVVADNGLTQADRTRFYTLPEGSELFPLAWLMRLESVATRRPFTENLERFGFIYAEQPLNEYNLPIGLTYSESQILPLTIVGVNCAACHVGEIRYRDQPRLRVDGAPSNLDIDAFYQDLINSATAALQSRSKLVRLLMGPSPDLGAVADAPPRDARLDAIRDSFANLDALRAEGRVGARLAAVLALLVDNATRRFEADYRAHGHQALTRLLLDADDPADEVSADDGPADDGPYPDRLRRIIEEIGELRSASELEADAPLTRNALMTPRLLERWATRFDRRVRLLHARIEFLRTLASRPWGGTTPLHGRVDAFGSARNVLFGREHGYMATNAPVSYPHLWGFEKVAWLHWNANTNSVLERNIGQALGLGAVVDTETWDSSLLFENLHELEQLAYKIQPPKWPEGMLGTIDADKARAGANIYEAHCAGCHEQVMATPEGLLDFPLFPTENIGTDPYHALEFDRPVGDMSFPDAIASVQGKLKQHYFEEHAVSEAVQLAWEGGRQDVTWRSPRSYPARPLAGAWATAPYLHNNSVPTLWHLLLPPSQRPTQFKVGVREYDPKHVGYVFELDSSSNESSIHDTRLPGNHNTGHDYGTGLSEPERWALLEYLKTK